MRLLPLREAELILLHVRQPLDPLTSYEGIIVSQQHYSPSETWT